MPIAREAYVLFQRVTNHGIRLPKGRSNWLWKGITVLDLIGVVREAVIYIDRSVRRGGEAVDDVVREVHMDCGR
jgi:hypothetical protein